MKNKQRSIYQTFVLIFGLMMSVSSFAQDTTSIIYPTNQSLTAEIKYFAQDSIISYPSEKIIELYNGAFIKYLDFELQAGYIRFNMNTDMVYAHGLTDTSGAIIQEPVFIQGGKSYDSDTILFNMKTKKGKIQQVFTKEGDGYLYGYDIKKMPDNSFFFKEGKYTTCNHPEPHFYLRASKLKLTNDKKVITGPANLVIGGVKTPLVLPFGYFPMQEKKSIGIVLPSYNFSASRGYSLNGLGFYVGISDFWDNRTTFDLYTGGSFRVANTFRYSKRYKYNGNLTFNYSTTEDILDPLSDRTDYSFIWTHRQDSKANPFGTFSANVDLTSGGFNQNNFESFGNQVKSSYYSNIGYTRSLFNNKATLTLTADHRMTNTGERPVTMNLPNVELRSNQAIFPFRTKKNFEKNNLISRINFTPTFQSKTEVHTYDSLMFTSNMFDDVRAGAFYSAPVQLDLVQSSFFSITPRFSYEGYFFTKKYNYSWKEDDDLLVKTAQDGIYHLYDYNAGVNFRLNPIFYGLFQFNSEKVKALRHVFEPKFSYTYNFDFLDQQRYYQEVQDDPSGRTAYYSQYNNGVYTAPGSATPSNGRKWGSLGIALENNIELKIKDNKYTKEDSLVLEEGGRLEEKYKKLKIFEALDFTSNYDFDVDSFRLSSIAINTRSNLGSNLSINNRITFDPYANNGSHQINKYFWEKSSPVGRIRSVTTNLGYSFVGKSKSGKTTEEKLNTVDESKYSDAELRTLYAAKDRPYEYLDFDVPYTLSINYALTYTDPIASRSTIDHSVVLNGDVNLTKDWKIIYNASYNFTAKDFTAARFSFQRNLHCWEMSFDWVPFGPLRSYGFNIRVKASVLQDLKLNRRRNPGDRLY